MPMLKNILVNSAPYKWVNFITSWVRWAKRDFQAPSPQYIKERILLSYGLKHAIWIETGTYLGQTTKALSKDALKVYTIEPDLFLFKNASNYFKNTSHIEVINHTSEFYLPTLLLSISGNVNFWLDGHYSAGNTFKGEIETPIELELSAISEHLSKLDKVAIFIDDVRCFKKSDGDDSQYPSLNYLVDWAKAHDFHWIIEHDIFIAKNYLL